MLQKKKKAACPRFLAARYSPTATCAVPASRDHMKLADTNNLNRKSEVAAPPLTVSNYFASCDQTSGSTGVPSAFTAVRADGFNPRALTMVGATCVVAVSAKMVCG
jgi:hypothetical protein